jgi:hypothetical protein
MMRDWICQPHTGLILSITCRIGLFSRSTGFFSRRLTCLLLVVAIWMLWESMEIDRMRAFERVIEAASLGPTLWVQAGFCLRECSKWFRLYQSLIHDLLWAASQCCTEVDYQEFTEQLFIYSEPLLHPFGSTASWHVIWCLIANWKGLYSGCNDRCRQLRIRKNLDIRQIYLACRNPRSSNIDLIWVNCTYRPWRCLFGRRNWGLWKSLWVSVAVSLSLCESCYQLDEENLRLQDKSEKNAVYYSFGRSFTKVTERRGPCKIAWVAFGASCLASWPNQPVKTYIKNTLVSWPSIYFR